MVVVMPMVDTTRKNVSSFDSLPLCMFHGADLF